MRTWDDEFLLREKQRRKYFENPKYRKWSDVVDKCWDEDDSDENDYREFRDDVLFSSYIVNGPIEYVDSKIVIDLLEVGHTLPIDWTSFYAYFDERFNDPENIFKSEFNWPCAGTGETGHFRRLKDVLAEYREKLLPPPCDMV